MEQSTQRRRLIKASNVFSPFIPHPVSTAASCIFCSGKTVVRPHGTTYCCKRAEAAVQQKLISQIEDRLEDELKDPALDDHTRMSMGHMLRTIRSAKKL